MSGPRDTGDLAEVPEVERWDIDGHPADIAGDDVDLSDVYDDPGEVVEL